MIVDDANVEAPNSFGRCFGSTLIYIYIVIYWPSHWQIRGRKEDGRLQKISPICRCLGIRLPNAAYGGRSYPSGLRVKILSALGTVMEQQQGLA